MSWAKDEQRRCRAVYEVAVSGWHRARDEGHFVPETDSHERFAGVRWKVLNPEGRAAMSAFQLAKSNLDHITERVQREAGDTKCPTCPEKDELGRVVDKLRAIGEPDTRLPPERDEEAAS